MRLFFATLLLLSLFASPAFGQTLRVLTFNTWLLRVQYHRKIPIAKDIKPRLAAMPAEIARTGADLVAFQEVWEDELRDALVAGMARQGYPYAAFREGQSDGKSFRGKIGNGLLVVSRYPIDPAIGLLHFTAFTALEEYFAMKGAIHLLVQLPGTGWVDFYDSHLGAVRWNSKKQREHRLQREMRYFQAMELREFVRRTAKTGIQIIGADLNASPYPAPGQPSREYALFVGRGGFVDSFHAVNGFDSPAYTYDPETNPYAAAEGEVRASRRLYIDYILVSGAPGCIEPESSELVFREPIRAEDTAETEGRRIFLSDHYGVLSTLSLNPACAARR
ncbi:MAG: endonuclease/exonuclease/phosphatase family protein [Oligoflexia bacterium]|nr:endonuclease/exonuclease/phosphatase family protein [Oligoflexia bacterium]